MTEILEILDEVRDRLEEIRDLASFDDLGNEEDFRSSLQEILELADKALEVLQ